MGCQPSHEGALSRAVDIAAERCDFWRYLAELCAWQGAETLPADPPQTKDPYNLQGGRVIGEPLHFTCERHRPEFFENALT